MALTSRPRPVLRDGIPAGDALALAPAARVVAGASGLAETAGPAAQLAGWSEPAALAAVAAGGDPVWQRSEDCTASEGALWAARLRPLTEIGSLRGMHYNRSKPIAPYMLSMFTAFPCVRSDGALPAWQHNHGHHCHELADDFGATCDNQRDFGLLPAVSIQLQATAMRSCGGVLITRAWRHRRRSSRRLSDGGLARPVLDPGGRQRRRQLRLLPRGQVLVVEARSRRRRHVRAAENILRGSAAGRRRRDMRSAAHSPVRHVGCAVHVRLGRCSAGVEAASAVEAAQRGVRAVVDRGEGVRRAPMVLSEALVLGKPGSAGDRPFMLL